jgi:maleylacetoacetate isomerase
MTRPILYDYWRSSAAYRVRIALNLKGIDYESRAIDLRDDQQKSTEYRALNPQGLVPTLEIDGQRLTQSLAIINYLDLKYPNQPLLPASAASRAHVVAMAMTVACDIHPLNNLRVLKYLRSQLGVTEEAKDEWYRHWVAEGLAALEEMARPEAGAFLFGDSPTIADVCLVPQLYNARRFSVPLTDYPTLRRADETASAHAAFAAAHPDRQEY